MVRGGGRQLAEKLKTLSNQVLYRALLRAGSVSFIPERIPILEMAPTMVVGIALHGYRQFSIVASLKKELDSFYSNSGNITRPSHLNPKKQWFLQLTEEFDAALEAFRQMQKTYPQHVVVYRLVDSFDRQTTCEAERLLMTSALAVKNKGGSQLRKTSLTYLLTLDVAWHERSFLDNNVNCKYFSLDGPGKSFQSVKRGCLIDQDDLSFSVMVQDRTQFGIDMVKDEARSASDKQLRTFATKFQILKGQDEKMDPDHKENIKKLSFRLCYFSQCPRTGLGANRLPAVITYAKKLMKYVRCSCKVGAVCAEAKAREAAEKER